MNFLIEMLGLLYLACALALSVYALRSYGILAVLFRYARQPLPPPPVTACGSSSPLPHWPDVVTQLPIYNEANVAARIISAAALMDYPGHHAIQVLDDSDDETCEAIDHVAADLRAAGRTIEVIRRPHRSGYKAGALSAGMNLSSAPFLAVFDADFIPPRDFLVRALPALLADDRAGFVQGRWTFLNERDSILTRAQSVGLDSHFAIEQHARASHPAMFMNFNGTAGIWRREAIDAAGGWSAATLTEDLELSYRVQLKGWHGRFLPDLAVPGELPPTFSAYKSQQFRWAKGSMQTALRLLPAVFRSDMPIAAKLEAFFHLTHYAVHPLLFVVVALAPLLALARGGLSLPGVAGWILLTAAFAPTFFYGAGQAILHRDWPIRLLRLPALTLAGMGLAASNSRAIAEAVIGHNSPFLRTPKRGDTETHHYQVKFPVPPALEIAVGFYSLAGALLAWNSGHSGIAHFGLLAAASFLYMGSSSLREQFHSPNPRSPACTPDQDQAASAL